MSTNFAFAQQSGFQQPDNQSTRQRLQHFNNIDDYDYTIGFGAISLMIQVIELDCEWVNQVNSMDRSSQEATTKVDSCCTRHMMGYYALNDPEDFVVPVIFGIKQSFIHLTLGLWYWLMVLSLVVVYLYQDSCGLLFLSRELKLKVVL